RSGAEKRDADRILLEVEHQARHLAVRAQHLDELAGHRLAEAVHAGDAVAHLEHGAGLVAVGREVEALKLLLEKGADFVGFDLGRHNVSCVFYATASCRRASSSLWLR